MAIMLNSDIETDYYCKAALKQSVLYKVLYE